MDTLNALHFQFGAPLGVVPGALLTAAVAFLAARYYRGKLKGLPAAKRGALTALRAAAIALVCFLLLDPMLVGYRLDPGQNYVLALFDDSLSMSVPDRNGQSRGARLRQTYAAAGESFEGVLRARYRLAMYGYGDRASRIDSVDELGFDQKASRHAGSVRDALRDFRGANVAAVILFSDGSEQPPRALAEALADVPADTPVVAVGVGADEDWRDLSLNPLAVSRSQGDDRPVSAKISFRAEGLAGRAAQVEILRGDRILAAKTLDIETEDETHETQLQFTPEREGWVAYRARVRLKGRAAGEPVAGDWIYQNNERAILVDNRALELRALYFAGRPNWENKFVQRAVEADEEIRMTSVVRISAAETKFVYRGKRSSLVNPLFEGFYKDAADQPRYDESVFLRFGGDPASAGKGFPEKAEELFDYDLAILGDIEAQFFSQNQLQIAREFVRKRGGSLLLLGGPHAFSEGRYAGTPLEGLLPVLLDRKTAFEGDPPANLTQSFRAEPTVEGELHGAWLLDPNPQENRRLWSDLPELAGLNMFPATRPGASVLALARAEDAGMENAPLFALQRYGLGHAAVLASGSTWQWHMGTAANDERHGRFWRRLARALALQAPEAVVWRDKRELYLEDRAVPFELLVRDRLFDERSGLNIRAFIQRPDGQETPLPVDESLREAGVYSGRFTPEQSGLHRVSLTAEDADGKMIGVLEEAFLAEPDREEFNHARYNPDYLKALSEKTGGRFFTLDQLAEIPDRIPWAKTNAAREVRLPFWHMPAFYFVLAALWLIEWTLRRKGGHA